MQAARRLRGRPAALIAGLAVAALGFGRPNVAGASGITALVKSDHAALRVSASETSNALAMLSRDTEVHFPGALNCTDWCQVGASGYRGWIRASDLWFSNGVIAFWAHSYSRSVSLLVEESAREATSIRWSYLQMFKGYALLRLDRRAEAVESFLGVARRAPPTRFTPFAFLVAAGERVDQRDLDGAVAIYRALLVAYPDYRVEPAACDRSAVVVLSAACGGDPSVRRRVSAIEDLMAAQAAFARERARPRATPEQIAAAWYSEGVAWDRFRETGQPSAVGGARECFEAAVAAAPGSNAAGDAAWKLIGFSRPYEWEGDVEAKTRWELDRYGAFLRNHPNHAHAADAMLNVAMATWARGGYPEVARYAYGKDLAAERARLAFLDQWFDTRGFGGGIGATAATPDPNQARRALSVFQDLLSQYPSSVQAPMARYWIAVILDYCLDQRAAAAAAYKEFLAHPHVSLFGDKALKRLAVLAAG